MSRKFQKFKFEEYALKLDAKDFACRSKAKAKPQRREPAGASPRIVPIGKRTWTDVEPGKYSFSDYEVSKNVMYLLRHSQHVYREEDGGVQFWRIKEHLQKYFLYCPHWSESKWKACLAAVKRKPPNTENWLRKLYDKNYNNDTSNENKHETNYSMNNDTRNMHIT